MQQPLEQTIALELQMHAKEARRIVEAIKNHISTARALLLDLYLRQGWRSLGYSSWRDCVTHEFDDDQSRLYQQLDAALLETILNTGSDSTFVEIGTIPESHLRPLARHKKDPEFVQQAWQQAIDTAPEGRVTGSHVEQTVKNLLSPKHAPGSVVTAQQGDFAGQEFTVVETDDVVVWGRAKNDAIVPLLTVELATPDNEELAPIEEKQKQRKLSGTEILNYRLSAAYAEIALLKDRLKMTLPYLSGEVKSAIESALA